jgi:hypothetical protein
VGLVLNIFSKLFCFANSHDSNLRAKNCWHHVGSTYVSNT